MTSLLVLVLHTRSSTSKPPQTPHTSPPHCPAIGARPFLFLMVPMMECDSDDDDQHPLPHCEMRVGVHQIRAVVLLLFADWHEFLNKCGLKHTRTRTHTRTCFMQAAMSHKAAESSSVVWLWDAASRDRACPCLAPPPDSDAALRLPLFLPPPFRRFCATPPLLPPALSSSFFCGTKCMFPLPSCTHDNPHARAHPPVQTLRATHQASCHPALRWLESPRPRGQAKPSAMQKSDTGVERAVRFAPRSNLPTRRTATRTTKTRS